MQVANIITNFSVALFDLFIGSTFLHIQHPVQAFSSEMKQISV